MEFIVFDTQIRFNKFMKYDEDKPWIVKELHLINDRNIWFETDYDKSSYNLSIGERYVHVNPSIQRIKKPYTIYSTLRLTPQNFKYNYRSSKLIVYKKSFWRNHTIITKKVHSHFMKVTDGEDITIHGNMYWNPVKNIMYVILNS